MPYTYEEYLHKLKGSKMTENDLKELFDREKLRDEKFHNLIEENEILMGKLKTANKYKYPKCTDCIHAHMDKDGNHDCGFMDCVSEQDKKYPDDTPFESYMSCYDCFQKIVQLNKAKEIISKIIIAVTEGISAVIPPIIAEAEQFLKEK